MTLTSAREGLSAKGVALWPHENTTVEKVSLQQPFPGTGKLQAPASSRHRKVPDTGKQAAQGRETEGCPGSLPGADVWVAEQDRAGNPAGLRGLAELWTRTLGSGDIRKVGNFRTECRGDGGVDRGPGVWRGAHQVFGGVLVHVWEETPSPREEIPESRRPQLAPVR